MHVTQRFRDRLMSFFPVSGSAAAAQAARAQRLWAEGQFEDALAAFEAALRLDPDNTNALRGLGKALALMDRASDARVIYQHLLALQPDASEDRFRFADVLFRLGAAREARAHYREAIARCPDILGQHALVSASHYGDALGTVAMDNRALCDWTDFAGEEQEILDGVRNHGAHLWPGDVAFIASTPVDQLTCAKARSVALGLSHNPSFELPPRTGCTRLRLGYISGDFHLIPQRF
jgi:tetratricopeptide (TPR) repeat protein